MRRSIEIVAVGREQARIYLSLSERRALCTSLMAVFCDVCSCAKKQNVRCNIMTSQVEGEELINLLLEGICAKCA